MLSVLVAGAKETYAFTGRLAELSLIEPVQIDIEFVDGKRDQIAGSLLDSRRCAQSIACGANWRSCAIASFLEWMYFQMASISHVSASGRPQETGG